MLGLFFAAVKRHRAKSHWDKDFNYHWTRRWNGKAHCSSNITADCRQ